MSQRSMMNRARRCWSIIILMLLTVAPQVAHAATHNVTGGTVTGNDYEDQVLGAGYGEGDVWGGEQGTTPDPTATPDPDGDLVPAKSIDMQVSSGMAHWLTRLSSLLAWFRSSLWFSNLN